MPDNLNKKINNRINSAMIFAAGLGLRMRPLTENTPKPLIKINNKNLIDYSIYMLDEAEIKHKIINSFYLSSQIDDHFENRKNIIISREKERLETGGGLKNALPLFNEKNILTLNSDVIFEYKNTNPVTNLINHWDENKFDILMLLVKKENAIGYSGDGDFNLNNNDLLSKDNLNEYVYTGLQIINSSILQYFDKKIFSLSEVFTKCLSENKLGGIIHDGRIFHVGDMESLKISEKLIKASG